MSLRVIVDENMPAVEEHLPASVDVQRLPGREIQPLDLARADALLVRSVTRVDQALLQRSPLQFVGSATSGIDHIDRDYLASRQIAFQHAPGANANSVVEYVLAAIAAIDGHLEGLLQGNRVGVVGYGHVGRSLVARLQALGISCRVSDPWLDQAEVPQAASLNEILQCEVICLHPELTSRRPWPSHHLLGEAELALLRQGQLLINASRGPVVDNAALLQRLQARDAPAVVLDVWEGEPAFNPDLLQLVNIGTAHIAGYSLDSKRLASAMLCRALCDHFGLADVSGQAPDTGRAPLSFTPRLEPAQQIRHLLGQRYDIGEDDRLLRSLQDDRARGFDRLRRDYRERRELAGSQLQSSGLDANAIALLRALGCSSAGSAEA